MDRESFSSSKKPGLRQDILSFAENDPRRKRFFICLKMLAILPCHENNKQLRYNINVKIKGNGEQIDTDSMLYTKPQRIHDELISSHVTCCEHNMPFFAYYHRNMLIYTEMQLNYADQYLRLQSAEDQTENIDLWQRLMDEYREMIQEMKAKNIFEQKVMMHYWNPTNYTFYQHSSKSTHFPIELLPKSKLETIDVLFQAVNDHLPWNFNFRTRFFSHLTEQQYKNMNIAAQMNDFMAFQPYLKYTEEEKIIISGQANPRSKRPQMVRHFFDNYIRRVNGRSSIPINAIIANEVGIRNKQYFDRQGKQETIPLYNMTQNQFALNYGTNTNNMQWLNPTQVKQVNSFLRTPKMIPEYYNSLLPHYQFAYSYVKSQKSLISSYLGGAASASSPTDYQRRLQNSHNTMHNNLAFIMSDPNFSLTNLIFFPFHSWIDYQLQVKIRQLSNDPVAYNIAQKQLAFKRQRTVYDIVSKEKGPLTIGSYKLVDWVDPRVGAWRWNSSQSQQAAKFYFKKFKLHPQQSFRYSFKKTSFADFVVNANKKTIRRSDDLQKIYASEYQIQSEDNQRFGYFINLKEYNFNYNYEIYDEGKRIFMDGNVPVLPSHILKIVQVIGGNRQPKVNVPTKPKVITLSDTNQEIVQLQSSPSDNFPNSFLPLKIKQRLLQNSILALGKYSSLIKSNIYNIEIKFLINKFELQPKLLTQSDIQYIKSGFLIKSFSILSKGQSSVTCPKCVPTKKFWIDVGDKLRETFPNIWKVVNLQMLSKNKILYDSSKSQKENEQNSLFTSQLIKLEADTQKFRPFLILEGAEEVEFDVILSNSFIKDEVSVKFELQVFSMFNEKIQSVITKTLYSLQQEKSLKHFDFYKVMDVGSSLAENNFNEFDKYYYKKVRCQIIIGSEMKIFEFKIPNYHRLVRYLVKIEYLDKKQDASRISVIVEDKDFEFKRNYYLEWQDDTIQ